MVSNSKLLTHYFNLAQVYYQLKQYNLTVNTLYQLLSIAKMLYIKKIYKSSTYSQ